jgi:RNA polymerase sigma-70 factor, ECF subfamily
LATPPPAAGNVAAFKPGRATAEGTDRAATLRQEALHDAGLVRRFNAGDETAFVEIVERYRHKLFGVALGLLRNRADAEEIAQDAFIRAHRGLARFRGDSSLSAWLHCITLNLSRNRYWYFFRRRRHATFSLDCTFSDHNQATFSDLVATDAAGPAREAVAREFSELVTVCMDRLGARPREILTLRNSLNRSYGEIARELGISVGTVKSRIARARASLRALLAKACPEFGPGAPPVAWFDPVRPSGGVETICA